MISELYGKKTGCSAGFGGSMHLIDKKKKFIRVIKDTNNQLFAKIKSQNIKIKP